MTIASAVRKYIDDHPFLEEALTDGIINYAGLARHMNPFIEKELDKTVAEGAIIMALKRLSPNYYYQVSAGIKNFLRRLGDFILRSKIHVYTYRNSPNLILKQGRLLEKAGSRPDLFCSCSQGINESTIALSDDLISEMKALFAEETLVSERSNLASITALLPRDNTEISGIYYFLFKQLAWSDINVVEVISTTNEITLIVDESQVEQSFSVLRKLTQT
jgi:hypothetical protein